MNLTHGFFSSFEKDLVCNVSRKLSMEDIEMSEYDELEAIRSYMHNHYDSIHKSVLKESRDSSKTDYLQGKEIGYGIEVSLATHINDAVVSEIEGMPDKTVKRGKTIVHNPVN